MAPFGAICRIEALEEAVRQRGCTAVRLAKVLWQNFIGNIKVVEDLDRYPRAPIDPAYYERLLAEAAGQSEDEFRARKLMRARSACHTAPVPPPPDAQPPPAARAAASASSDLGSLEA